MSELSQELRALLDTPSEAARAFDDATWRALDARLAVRALGTLVDKIDAIHEAGFQLGGVRRTVHSPAPHAPLSSLPCSTTCTAPLGPRSSVTRTAESGS